MSRPNGRAEGKASASGDASGTKVCVSGEVMCRAARILIAPSLARNGGGQQAPDRLGVDASRLSREPLRVPVVKH